jgi:RimJ/RimL family protein N-acetyltransferase
VRLAEPVTGIAFGLRSPAADDAQFTVELRSSPEVVRYLHRIPGDLASQRAWEDMAMARDDDLPLVVFRRATGAPEGTIGIYRIDRLHETAEWGRWALRRDSLAAVESVLLVFDLAFNTVRLKSLYCRTLTGNSRAIAFHDALGLERELTGLVDVDGREQPYVQHRIASDAWPAAHERLQELAFGVARRLA